MSSLDTDKVCLLQSGQSNRVDILQTDCEPWDGIMAIIATQPLADVIKGPVFHSQTQVDTKSKSEMY